MAKKVLIVLDDDTLERTTEYQKLYKEVQGKKVSRDYVINLFIRSSKKEIDILFEKLKSIANQLDNL